MADQNPPGDMPEPPPGGGAERADVAAALSWAFDRFKSNVTVFVGLAAVVTVIYVLQGVGTTPLQNILTDCTNPQTEGQIAACAAAFGVSAIVAITLSLVFAIVAFIAQYPVQQAAIRSTQGVTPTFSEMFSTPYLGRYILYVIVFVILMVAGLVMCIVPGLLVIFFGQLGPYYILDKGLSVGDAAKASIAAVRRNISPALLMTLVNFLLIQVLGGLFLGLPTLVTLPFAVLFTAHLYRQFNREPIV